MFRQTVGMQTKRRTDLNFGMKYLANWTCSGSVKPVQEHGRNCVKLTSRIRKARIRHRPIVNEGARLNASVDIFSPLGNKELGAGLIKSGNGVGWEATQGQWKRVEVPLTRGQDVIIECAGWEGCHESGDVCFVDLGSLRIEADRKPLRSV